MARSCGGRKGRLFFLHAKTFLARHRSADIKRLARIRGFELRTFCTCRRGEVWNLQYGDYAAISGRSDGSPTEYSNFGFLVRFDGQALSTGREVWEHLRQGLKGRPTALFQPLGEFLGERWPEDIHPEERPWYPRGAFVRGDVSGALGTTLGPIMREGVRGLLEWAPELRDPRAVCLFPAIEGVGEFPAADLNLRIGDENLWCAGDMVGRMRGLVPSLVSGYYAGLNARSSYLRRTV